MRMLGAECLLSYRQCALLERPRPGNVALIVEQAGEVIEAQRSFRRLGCRDLLVYCGSIHCSHGTRLNGDRFSDETPIRPLGARMVCTQCGHIGADVRPDWSPHTNKSPPP
jgi:hypothetical protein